MPLVLGASLEQLMLSGAHRLFAKLTLHNLEAFGNLLVFHGSAVAAQQKLRDVGGNRVLSLKLAHQVLAHYVAFVGPRRNRVYGIQLLAHRVSFQGSWPGYRSPAHSRPAERSPPACRYRRHLRGRP